MLHWSGLQESRFSLLAPRCPADLEVRAHLSPLSPNSGRHGTRGGSCLLGGGGCRGCPSPPRRPPSPRPLGGFFALRDPDQGYWVLSPEGAASGCRWSPLLPSSEADPPPRPAHGLGKWTLLSQGSACGDQRGRGGKGEDPTQALHTLIPSQNQTPHLLCIKPSGRVPMGLLGAPGLLPLRHLELEAGTSALAPLVGNERNTP